MLIISNYDEMKSETKDQLMKCQFEHENQRDSKSKAVEALLNNLYLNDLDKTESEY